jgi:hypothetical protein
MRRKRAVHRDIERRLDFHFTLGLRCLSPPNVSRLRLMRRLRSGSLTLHDQPTQRKERYELQYSKGYEQDVYEQQQP